MFWALSEEHSFKIAFKERFPLKTPLTSEDIKTRLNALLMSNLGYETNTATKATQILSLFCKKGRRINYRNKGNCYRIQNYDVNDFGIPLKKIEVNTNVRDLFRFY